MHDHISQFHKDLDTWEASDPRRKTYDQISHLAISGLQRMLNEKRLPANPTAAHWERYVVSEGMTIAQQQAGIYLPLHEAMEHGLSRILAAVDSRFKHHGVDKVIYIKSSVQNWFDAYIRHPAAQAVTNMQRRR